MMRRLGWALLTVLTGCSGGGGSAVDFALAPDLAPACAAASWVEDVTACKPLATDYQPRLNMSRDDLWPPCISDDGVYHLVDPNHLEGLALAGSVDEIGRLLFGGRTPAPADFEAARVVYERPNGLTRFLPGSEDLHYPAPTGGRDCNEPGISTRHPARCVGAAKLVPLLHDAFTHGASGDRPRLHAVRIEAALLWYLYLRTLWNANAAGQIAFYGDDAWAVYGGGQGIDNPSALGRHVRAAGPGTHARAWDGLLAIRCWRDLDKTSTAAKNTELGKRAFDQLDRALMRSIAVVLRRRLGDLECASVSEEKAAHLAFVRLFGELIDRGARAANPGKADALARALAAQPAGEAEIAAARTALDGLLPCP